LAFCAPLARCGKPALFWGRIAIIRIARERITESLLIITGTMGAGKSSVLAEASDILTLRHIVHAAIDLDALGLAHLPTSTGNNGVMYRNYRAGS
jgi:ABC-type uncharacterized transport system YnjBCD ATPase subunit